MIKSVVVGGSEFKVSRWKGEKLGAVIAVDTETSLIKRGLVPRLFSCQAFDGKTAVYVNKEDVGGFFATHTESCFVFHNAAFDLSVLNEVLGSLFPSIYDLVDEERVGDTSILERLIGLAIEGQIPHKYNLALLSKKYLDEDLDKSVRDSFDQEELTFETMSEEQQIYGIKDAVCTYLIFMKQLQIIEELGYGWLSHSIQVKGDVALNKLNNTGIHIDIQRKIELEANLQKKKNILTDVLSTYGMFLGRPGSKQSFDNIMDFYGIKLERTKDGNYKSSEDDLLPYAKNNHFIQTYLEYKYIEKHMGFFNKLTEPHIFPRYSLLVDTGRTACSNPNFQQLPKVGGIRELFVPKPGRKFVATDYRAIELATLAQILYARFGRSVMKDKINEGHDLHKYFASTLLKKGVDEVSKDERQGAKAANFGFPGGLGIDRFVDYARTNYGVTMTQKEAKAAKEAWFKAYPEVRGYMQGNTGTAITLTGRIRSNCGYCEEKNTPFQGLASDGAKIALYNLIIKKGLKVVGFVHDEIVTECTTKDVEEVLKIQEEVMISSMQEVVPDVLITVESTVLDRYSK